MPIMRAGCVTACCRVSGKGGIMTIVSIIQWLGELFAFIILALLLFGVWRGTQRKAGRTIGLKGRWLRSPWVYLALCALFIGLAYLGWIPLPRKVPPTAHAWMLAIGPCSTSPVWPWCCGAGWRSAKATSSRPASVRSCSPVTNSSQAGRMPSFGTQCISVYCSPPGAAC